MRIDDLTGRTRRMAANRSDIRGLSHCTDLTIRITLAVVFACRTVVAVTCSCHHTAAVIIATGAGSEVSRTACVAAGLSVGGAGLVPPGLTVLAGRRRPILPSRALPDTIGG